MFSSYKLSLRTLKYPIFKLHETAGFTGKLTVRPFSSTFKHLNTTIPEVKPKSRFDKSLLKPLFLILVLTSLLNNVTEQKKKNTALEKRYEMKLEKYEQLIERAKKTGQTEFNMDAEFKLINRMFERSGNFTFSPKIPGAKLQTFDEDDEEEDLSKLFSDIMTDANKSTEELQQAANSNDIKLSASDINEDEIVTNEDFLHKENEIEQNIMKSYKADTSQHIIVERSGDFTSAPEASKVQKFL